MANVKIPKSKKLIYLDYAATTPLDPAVLKAMLPFLREEYGNPSSIYALGQRAKIAMENSRQIIADILQCKSREIVFTAGGTESANLAIFGVVWGLFNKSKQPVHIITSSIEHHAVLFPFQVLEKHGVEVTYLPVDEFGFVRIKDFIAAIKPNTVFASIMYANNEIGTVEPIAELSRELNKINLNRQKNNLPKIYLHTDACQAAGSLNINVQHLGVDLMTLNASKIYGPKQVGLLYVRSGTPIEPIIYGGGQENDLRSGTENVAGVVGFAKALQLAQKNTVKENARLLKLRNYFISKILKIDGTRLNGPLPEKDSEKKFLRLPNNINVSFAGLEGETVMLYLDAQNIAVSTGSACVTAGTDPSHVILALGKSKEAAAGAVRFTLGSDTTKQQLDYVLKVLPPLIKMLRSAQYHKQSEDYIK